MHKKKVHHEEHVDEAWLLPYADLLTLLLALFIVMFAMSKVDQEKFEKLSKEFNTVFAGGSGIMEKDGKSIIELHPSGAKKNNSADDSSTTASATGIKGSRQAVEEDTMNEIKKNLEKEIDRKGYTEQVKVVLDNEGLHISIQDVVLFNSGDAEVLTNVYPLLLQISGMIKKIDNSIRIVGHTDNIPINTKNFRSNWDLSAFRSINVMTFMIDKGKLESEKFSIQAYGEFKPKFDNKSEEGRSKNRRVEIMIVRKYPLTTQ